MSVWEKIKTVYLVDLLESFSIAMAISVIIYYVFLIPNMVEGQSMEPTFHDRELLFTDRTIQWLGGTDVGKNLNYNYHHGDVVIFQSRGSDLIKRIIAIGGDKLKIQDGSVFINGQKLKEDYIPTGLLTYMPFMFESTFKEGQEVTVPEGYYFLMGDNRNNSKDSRFKDVGYINRIDIKGRVLVRWWPINVFAVFTQN